jgi:hypothetical protein
MSALPRGTPYGTAERGPRLGRGAGCCR